MTDDAAPPLTQDGALWRPPLPPVPPIRPCVQCGRGFYTWMRPAVCLDCRVPVRRPDPDPGPGDVLAVLGVLFDG